MGSLSGGAAPERMAMPSNTVPYHPAAVRFYEEKGIWSEENAARDASLQ
ncbi:hypothetical protein GCM10011358_34530 [Sinisalibacter lacisalsi]|uniref:C4-dicarboxylate ABC transporter substrate-binding protein n=1 Tax=Sinisalibacter lacisalsi TaxID=1526570 RepID=A0ABQ1QX37_9RHOB|nr:hypothetical protein GCM10011358_34530 [Sinisalibacter lacisalsi]